MRLVSLDIETTGLDPTRHEAWEIAAISVEEPKSFLHFQMPVSRVGAEPKALEVGGFADRYRDRPPGSAIEIRSAVSRQVPADIAAVELHKFLNDATLLGCSVHFDANFLSELFRREGIIPVSPWHHRYLDLGSYAAGFYTYENPMGSSKMAEKIASNPDAHSAFADARWNIEVYNKIRNHEL